MAITSALKTDEARAGINDDIGEQTRLTLYRMQVEIREAEQRAFDLFLQNLVKGTSHLSLGQEAVAAGLEAEDALSMLTIEGARTLGWQRAIGSLEVGKAGDLAVFASPPPVRLRPVASALLTVIGGRAVYR